LLRQITAEIQVILPDAEVILYGSQARGAATRDSDWDLLVLTDAEVTYALERTVRRRMDDLSLDTDTVISAFIYNRQTWGSPLMQVSPYHQNIMRDGIAL
jgi:predicted nucleotidyltransferase